jgi:hypothetical protein
MRACASSTLSRSTLKASPQNKRRLCGRNVTSHTSFSNWSMATNAASRSTLFLCTRVSSNARRRPAGGHGGGGRGARRAQYGDVRGTPCETRHGKKIRGAAQVASGRVWLRTGMLRSRPNAAGTDLGSAVGSLRSLCRGPRHRYRTTSDVE